MTGNYNVVQWFALLGLIFGGFLIGLFVDRIALGKLRKLVARTRWNGDEIVINREGIEIPFPIRTVYFKETEKSGGQIEGSGNHN